jgi:hypothetical protein
LLPFDSTSIPSIISPDVLSSLLVARVGTGVVSGGGGVSDQEEERARSPPLSHSVHSICTPPSTAARSMHRVCKLTMAVGSKVSLSLPLSSRSTMKNVLHLSNDGFSFFTGERSFMPFKVHGHSWPYFCFRMATGL